LLNHSRTDKRNELSRLTDNETTPLLRWIAIPNSSQRGGAATNRGSLIRIREIVVHLLPFSTKLRFSSRKRSRNASNQSSELDQLVRRSYQARRHLAWSTSEAGLCHHKQCNFCPIISISPCLSRTPRP
jgi:hypothetical protein